MKFRLPIFETFISLLSCYLAIILFTNENFFNTNPITYGKLSELTSEATIACIFLVAAFTKIIGISFDIRWVRITGLCMSSVIYLVIAVTYYLGSVLWGLGIFSLLSIFCIINIVDVKNTKL